jgi:CBS-domain-containing membrane protein
MVARSARLLADAGGRGSQEPRRLASDVMTREVVLVTPDTPLPEIARLLETRRIKRVPVLQDGELVGIVSRADLLRGFALQQSPDANADDRALRQRLTVEFVRSGVKSHTYVNIVVCDGAVQALHGSRRSRPRRPVPAWS